MILAQMHGKSGALEETQAVFASNQLNLRIKTHAQHGQVKEAISSFDQLQQEAAIVDKETLVCLLSVCGSLTGLVKGKRIHACIMHNSMKADVVLGNALVSMYGKCGHVDDALEIFDHILQRDLVSWTAMITVYAKHGHGCKALQLFQQMQGEGVLPNRVTFISILSACASGAALAEGKRVHTCIGEGGFVSDIVLGTALVNMYGKCGKLKEAQDVFNMIAKRDIISWNAMIAAYAQHQQGVLALQQFGQMQMEGLRPNCVTFISVVDACANCRALADGQWMHVCIMEQGFESDVVLGTALVNMYGRCGTLEDALRVFERMPRRTLISWNALITVYAQQAKCREALHCLDLMQLEDLKPDKVTFVSILDACARQAALSEGKKLHSCIADKDLEQDLLVGNALINMYGKCGSLDSARDIFDKMPNLDIISWTAIIAAYAQHGHSEEALLLFHKMHKEGLMPDNVAFISGLAACTSQVALAEGEHMYSSILKNGIETDVAIGNALVTMYGRCGNLESSSWVFEEMPEHDVISWNAVLGALAQHGQAIEAIKLYSKMVQEDMSPNKLTFISVLSACSHFGMVDEGCHCFASMNQDYGVSPDVDLYDCMIDLLGRSGRIDEAESLVNGMPFQPTVLSFLALLGACRHSVDVDRGEYMAKQIIEVDPEHSAPYVMLSNLYVTASRDNFATEMICRMTNMFFRQPRGHYLPDKYGMMQGLFVDCSFFNEDLVYAELQR